MRSGTQTKKHWTRSSAGSRPWDEGGGGGGGRKQSPKNIFSALRASVLSKNKGGSLSGSATEKCVGILLYLDTYKS